MSLHRYKHLICISLCWCAVIAAQAADPFAALEQRMRRELGAGFHVTRCSVFVCAGNLERRAFDTVVDGTVRGASEALWTQYFTKRPTYPIAVYLFADEKSYRAGAKSLFGDTDVSEFGYYRPDDKALVMNIGTGTGTLVHEMLHALMAPDFPNAPTWFSEGLASLYEQCNVTPRGLVGLVNWRLPVLRAGQQAKTTLPLARLLATKPEEFLDRHLGVHYAQARYLCMYLQEQKVLETYYRAFRDGVKDDATGMKTLRRVTKHSLPDIEQAWQAWLDTLPK